MNNEKIYLQQMYINGWKSIQNEIGIDLTSTLRNSGKQQELYRKNVIFVDNKKVYNKIALTGSNAFGKTAFIESFNKIFFVLKNIPEWNYYEELSTSLKDIVNKKNDLLELKINLVYQGYTYSYELKLDFQKNIFEDQLIKFKKTGDKPLFKIRSKDFAEMNKRLLFHFPKETQIEKLPTSSQNEIERNILSISENTFTYAELNNITKQLGGQYLDFYNSNFETKYTNPTLGLNRLQIVLDTNKQKILDLYENNLDIWKEIVAFINKIDRQIFDIKIIEMDNGKIDYQYIDKEEKSHPFRSFASTGTISAFALCIWIYIHKNSYLLIDELDTSLNLKIIELLLSIEFIQDTQIIFTFHNLGLFFVESISPKQICIINNYNNNNKKINNWFDLTKNKQRKYVDIERYLNNYYGGQIIG